MLRKRRLNKKIDYHNKKYENPFFRQKQKRKRIKILNIFSSGRGKLISGGIFIMLMGITWLCCFSSLFNIEAVMTEGLIRISSQEVENLVWQQVKQKRFLFIPQKSLIMFSKKQLIEKLNENYCFENLTINKKFPDKLSINIQEKSYAFIWQEDDKYYYADIDGYIINEVSPLEIKQKRYPLIYNLREQGISDNKINTNSEYINYAIDLFSEFNNDFYDLSVERFIIDNDIDTIKMVIYEGPTVYFNIQEDKDKQIRKLLIIKNEKLKDDFKNKTYIDLRYGDKVYYR